MTLTHIILDVDIRSSLQKDVDQLTTATASSQHQCCLSILETRDSRICMEYSWYTHGTQYGYCAIGQLCVGPYLFRAYVDFGPCYEVVHNFHVLADVYSMSSNQHYWCVASLHTKHTNIVCRPYHRYMYMYM